MDDGAGAFADFKFFAEADGDDDPAFCGEPNGAGVVGRIHVGSLARFEGSSWEMWAEMGHG